jgi:hypothetical protein
VLLPVVLLFALLPEPAMSVLPQVRGDAERFLEWRLNAAHAQIF